MVAPSKSFTVIPDGDIDPDSPLTTGLMTNLRDNDVHNEEWIGDGFTAAKDHDHDGVNSKTVAGTLALVEEKTVSGASVSGLTFSGLDGDVDDMYMIVGRIEGDGATGGPASDRDIVLNPNGIITAQTTQNLSGAFPGLATRITIANWTGTAGRLAQFTMWFYASKLVGGAARNRHGSTQLNLYSAAAEDVELLGHRWAESATNITSLVFEIIKAGGAAVAEIAAGTSVALYRLRG